MYQKKVGDIEFEGKIVSPRAGIYRCPYCKGNNDPRYPAKTWKTEKGFRSHMESCHKKPSAVAKRDAAAEQKRIADEEKAEAQAIMDANAKETSPVKIGETVHVCDYYVSKPCYEQRGSRMVKVRYEEERVYYGRSFQVQDIKASERGGILLLFNNKWYSIALLKESLEAAKKEASERQSGYDAGRREASLYR